MPEKSYAWLVHHLFWTGADRRALYGKLVLLLLRRYRADHSRLLDPKSASLVISESRGE